MNKIREAVKRFQEGTDNVNNDLDWNTFVNLISNEIIGENVELTPGIDIRDGDKLPDYEGEAINYTKACQRERLNAN